MKFTIFESYFEAMKMLPEEACGHYIMSVMAYAFDGVEPSFEGVEQMAWLLMKPNIDASMRRQKAGSKGGRPAEKPAENQAENLTENQSENLTENQTGKPNGKPNRNLAFTKSKSDKEKDKEKDKEREKDTRESAGFPSFLKQCVEVFNDETGKRIIDTEIAGTTLMRVRTAYDNGRTVDEVRRAVKSAMEQWKPEMVTFNAIFKGSRIAELSASKKEPPKPKEWPETMPCPKCGADSRHVGGGVYSCPDGHEAWKETA